MSGLMHSLKEFDLVEANLVKLEHLWEDVQQYISNSISFGDNPEYEDRCRSFSALLAALPKIDGWKPNTELPDLNDIAQNRLDAMELGEPTAEIHVESWIEAPGKEIREYRFRFNQKRREIVRDALIALIDDIDADLRGIREKLADQDKGEKITAPLWDQLRDHVDQIEVLLGSTVPKPPRWGDLRRHIHFGYVGDFHDIERMDWPAVKEGLRKSLYGVYESLPVEVDDLSDLVAAKPHGQVTIELDWSSLDDEGFERLLFALISAEVGYENPEWLMRTQAPDRGRDLSVTRVTIDALSGTIRQRVVIQCKHWLTKSVTLADATSTKDQMALWTNPPVDILIVATSGRFTSDAVQWIEQHNAKGTPPRLEMWPESHLERLLAARPALIAEFKLR